jgi:hypothetical protein
MDQTATFNLTITQRTNKILSFDIYSPDVAWDMTTDPTTDRKLKVYPKTSKSTKLKFRPLYVNPGVYGVGVNVRWAEGNILEKKHVLIEVKSLEPVTGTYLPAIRGAASMKERVDPADDILVRIKLENQNRKDLSKITVKLRSNIINKDYDTTLKPLEKKTLEFNVKISPVTYPQIDILKVSIFAEEANQTYQFDLLPMEYEILRYGEIAEDITTEKEFLKRTEVITLTNTGNLPETKAYRTKVGFFRGFITTAEPEGTKIKTSAGRFLSWDIDLDVNTKATIRVTANYRPVAIAILLIIIGIIAYYTARSPVVIKKSAVIMRTKEGGISDLKVMLMIKNRGKHPLQNIEIIDKVPAIADVIKEEALGTLQPTKILRHERKGTLVKWRLDSLDKLEERIITYKIRSKLSILGGLTLPVAVVKFQGMSGRERVVCSNKKSLSEAY